MARSGLVVAVVALALAAGCADSGYDYHSNKAEKLYFKVPDDWTVYDTGDLLGETAAPSRAWLRGFVGDGGGDMDRVFLLGNDVPRGYVEILQLVGEERDDVSLRSLRGTRLLTDATGNEIDPIEYAEENPDGPLQILGLEDIALDHGAHGVRIRVAITQDDGDAIIDQTVLVDPATTKRYLLNIGCSIDCFELHMDEIEEVIESWTLEAR